MKIAHISDLHMTSLRHVRWPELFNKRILGYLSWCWRRRFIHKRAMLERLMAAVRRENPALLAVTGDLTQIGTVGECRQAQAWLDETARWCDLALVPGNHDCYIHTDYARTIGLWRRHFPGAALNGGNGHDGMFPAMRRLGDLALIGVNTGCPAPPFKATGRVGAAQLAALAALLREAGRDGLFRLVLMHHGPAPGTYDSRKHLTDEAGFAAVIRQHGAELILHGHGHNMSDDFIDGGGRRVPVSGVAAATAVAHDGHPPAGYKVYQIDKAETGWSVRCRAVSLRGGEQGAQQVEEKDYRLV